MLFVATSATEQELRARAIGEISTSAFAPILPTQFLHRGPSLSHPVQVLAARQAASARHNSSNAAPTTANHNSSSSNSSSAFSHQQPYATFRIDDSEEVHSSSSSYDNGESQLDYDRYDEMENDEDQYEQVSGNEEEGDGSMMDCEEYEEGEEQEEYDGDGYQL